MSCVGYNAVWTLDMRLVRWLGLIYNEFETTPCPISKKYGRIAGQRVEEIGLDIHLPSAALRRKGRMWKG